MKEINTIKIRSKEEIIIEWVENGLPSFKIVRRKDISRKEQIWFDNIIFMSDSLLKQNLGSSAEIDFSRAYHPPH